MEKKSISQYWKEMSFGLGGLAIFLSMMFVAWLMYVIVSEVIQMIKRIITKRSSQKYYDEMERKYGKV